MGRHLLIITIFLSSICLMPWSADAAPVIDSINVQGYMKKADNTAVTNGVYSVAFGVFQNGAPLWGTTGSVTITNGLFSRSLSGLGSNQLALPAGTGMNFDYSAVTLNPALLMSGGAGAVSVRVYAISSIDSANPQFDITFGSVPTAFVAETAKGVATGAVGLTGIATAAKTNASAGAADAGKLVLLDAVGYIDTSMIPPISGGLITSGSVGLGYGGTGATTAAGARANLSAAESGANSDITSLTGLTTPLSVAQGGTGSATAGGALTNLGAAASGANSDITSLTGLTTPLSVAQGGVGAATLTANSVLVGNGTSAVTGVAPGTTGNYLKSDGTNWTSAAPTFGDTATANTWAGLQTMTGGISIPAAGLVATSVRGSVTANGTFNGAAPLAHNNNHVMIVQGTGASALSCIAAGVNGQLLTVLFLGTAGTNGPGTGVTILHNQACASGMPTRTYANGTVTSTGANSTAMATFVYLTTAGSGVFADGWYLISVNL